MKLISILIAIIVCVILLVFLICVYILNAWLNESGLRYHLFDKEGDNDGEAHTRKSNRISKSVSEAKRVRKK